MFRNFLNISVTKVDGTLLLMLPKRLLSHPFIRRMLFQDVGRFSDGIDKLIGYSRSIEDTFVLVFLFSLVVPSLTITG